MKEYIPLIAGFVGALIGAGASIVTVFIQSYYQNRREISNHAMNIALEDWKTRLEFIQEEGGTMFPLAVFIQYHTSLAKLAHEGKITPEVINELHEEQERLIRALEENNAK